MRAVSNNKYKHINSYFLIMTVFCHLINLIKIDQVGLTYLCSFYVMAGFVSRELETNYLLCIFKPF